MHYPFDVELFSSLKKFGNWRALPTEMSPAEGHFLLLYVASGMKRGVWQTPSAVVKDFKKSHGRSPQQFKTEQSLHLAQYYILKTKMSFKMIALRLGFGSASYFTQFIRRETGKTPRDIRASGKWQKRRERKKL